MKIHVNSMPLTESTVVDSAIVERMGLFFSMHYFQDELILVNLLKNGGIPALNFYHAGDLSYHTEFLHYGRGPNEVIDVNPYYFDRQEDSFILNTNDYFLSDFRYDDGVVTKGQDTFIANTTINNLFITSSGHYICTPERRGEGKEFQIGEVGHSGDIRYFSDYPKTRIRYGNDPSDLATVCQATCVGSNTADRYMVLYTFLPLIRLFDLNGEEKSSIGIADYKQHAQSVDDIYNEDCTYFFDQPVVAGNHVFVLFLADDAPTGCQLLKFTWDGQLESRYSLPGGIRAYTVSDDQRYCYVLTMDSDDNDLLLKYRLR
ncbi:MAG TPA: hypothetical protein DEQ30_14225 [Porphyromonadaceae bacterium]|nr:hypothetical protein [Porphyromonadaceae bacterium]